MDNREKPARPNYAREPWPIIGEREKKARQSDELVPHKNARADAWQDGGRSWSWRFPAMGALVCFGSAFFAASLPIMGGAFAAGMAFLGLAELALIREAAQKRAAWPPCSPPVGFDASPDELAIAWAKIACECQAQGEAGRAADAWRRSGMAWAKEPGQ